MSASLQKSQPRMVTRTRYVGYLTAKAILRLAGKVLSGMGASMWALCGIFLIPLGMMAFYLMMRVLSNQGTQQTHDVFVFMCGVGTILYGGRHLMKVGRTVQQKADAMEPVIHMTPQLAASLPVQESLVRASIEPTQSQETVLLRPAQSSEETPAEQLLRPHGRHK